MKIRLFRPDEHKTTDNFEEIEVDVDKRQLITKNGIIYAYWFRDVANNEIVHYYYAQRGILNLDA